ncbi:MAG: MBL fold metallo-hydrolase [Chloroflexi bacterium]|nr:MBL fold metallo-hydrolase [Chloroflexota bacterium]
MTVGSVEIVRVTDGSITGPPAFFFSGIPPSMYEPALGSGLRSDGMIDIEFGSFLVRSSGKTLLIDTGMGNKRGSPGGRLLDSLKQIGVSPGDIDVVMNTHLHINHVGWNCIEQDGAFVPTFPNAEYWVAEKEWSFWTSDPDLVAEEGQHLVSDVLPLQDSPQLKLVDGEAAITPEVSLLPTPGHTPGYSSLAISSAGESAIILGDVAHHPLHLERLWIASVDELPRTSRRTKRALAQRLIDEQFTGGRRALLVGRVRAAGDGGWTAELANALARLRRVDLKRRVIGTRHVDPDLPSCRRLQL